MSQFKYFHHMYGIFVILMSMRIKSVWWSSVKAESEKKDLQTNRQLWWDHKYFHVNTPASTGKVVQWYRSLSYPTQQDVESFLRLVSFTWGNLFHTAEITGRPN